MAKLFEDTLSNFEYVMQALTLIGVVALIYKVFEINLSVDTKSDTPPATKSAFANGPNLRFLPGMDSTHERMLGSMEPPVFFSTAVDPAEMSQAAEVGLEHDYGSDIQGNWRVMQGPRVLDDWQYQNYNYGQARSYNSSGVSKVEGARGRRSGKPYQSGMVDKLDVAMAGGGGFTL